MQIHFMWKILSNQSNDPEGVIEKIIFTLWFCIFSFKSQAMGQQLQIYLGCTLVLICVKEDILVYKVCWIKSFCTDTVPPKALLLSPLYSQTRMYYLGQ